MTLPGATPDTLRLVIADRRGWIGRAVTSALDPAEWSSFTATTGDALVELVRRTTPHAILLNDDVGNGGAEALIRRLRAEPEVGILTPIIVVSTHALRARRVELLRAGATEHVLFPTDPEAFLLRLRALAVTRREVERMRRAVLIDLETGLYNLAGLERRGREIATDATRRREPVSCIALGTAPRAADSPSDRQVPIVVTAELGDIARRSSRLSDALGRIDDTLIVIAPATPPPGAQRLAERLREALERGMQARGGKAMPRRRSPRSQPAAGAPRILAAYCAVADFARSPADVPAMMERALASLSSIAGLRDAPPITGETIPLEPPS